MEFQKDYFYFLLLKSLYNNLKNVKKAFVPTEKSTLYL